MAGISSLGISSDIDVNTLLGNIEKAERKSLDSISRQQSSYTARLSGYGILKNALEEFQSANSTLAAAKTFTATSASSSSKAFSATINDSAACVGHYAINVTQLASTQMLTSSEKTDKNSAISGSDSILTFQQANGKAATSINLSATDSSLQGIRDAINAADAGVTASIIQVSAGSYILALSSVNTGSENTLSRVSVSGDSALQAYLSFDASSDSNGLTQRVAAQNAKLTIQNVAIDNSSNLLTEAIEGVTLNLSGVTRGGQALTISSNTAMVADAISTWVEAYNRLLDSFSTLTKYTAVEAQSAAQNTANGPLLGDSTVRTIESRLRSLLINAADHSTLKSLAQIGVTTLPGSGKLEVNGDTLNSTIASNANGLKEMIAGDGHTTGIASSIANDLQSWLASGGILQSATSGTSNTLEDLIVRYNTMNSRIDNRMAFHKAQLIEMKVALSKLEHTSSYLEQQFEISNRGR